MPHLVLLPIIVWLLAASNVGAGDEVRVLRGHDDTVHVVTGTIADWDRDILTLNTGNQSRTFPATTVLDIQTELDASHKRGRQHLERGQWPQAVDSLSLAFQRERRGWVRQRVMRDLALAYKLSGDIPHSAATALSLYREYPRTNQFDALPLSWTNTPASASIRQGATVWVEDARPESQLLGASWLLTGERRSTSIALLQRLSNESEPWVAQLATAQLWRIELATVQAEQCARWERIVGHMSPGMRAGPLFLLGQAWQRAGDDSRAAIAWMKIPVLHPDETDLAVDALLRAAGRMDVTERESAYQEIIKRYPFHPQASVAQQELDAAKRRKQPHG
jgi:hypothetical protein